MFFLAGVDLTVRANQAVVHASSNFRVQSFNNNLNSKLIELDDLSIW
jgi:hypothetical protein